MYPGHFARIQCRIAGPISERFIPAKPTTKAKLQRLGPLGVWPFASDLSGATSFYFGEVSQLRGGAKSNALGTGEIRNSHAFHQEPWSLLPVSPKVDVGSHLGRERPPRAFQLLGSNVVLPLG